MNIKKSTQQLVIYYSKLTWTSIINKYIQFSSVDQSCPTLCHPMNCSTPGLPVHHHLPEFTQTQRPSSPWCHPAISSSVVPFSSCPQSLPAWVFSNESTLRMRWPKYWSFSFSIIPSKEIPGLISHNFLYFSNRIFCLWFLIYQELCLKQCEVET